MKEILTLIIFISNIFQVENDSVLVNMVSFSGYAEGEYFKGNILPGLSCPMEVPISLHATC